MYKKEWGDIKAPDTLLSVLYETEDRQNFLEEVAQGSLCPRPVPCSSRYHLCLLLNLFSLLLCQMELVLARFSGIGLYSQNVGDGAKRIGSSRPSSAT